MILCEIFACISFRHNFDNSVWQIFHFHTYYTVSFWHFYYWFWTVFARISFRSLLMSCWSFSCFQATKSYQLSQLNCKTASYSNKLKLIRWHGFSKLTKSIRTRYLWYFEKTKNRVKPCTPKIFGPLSKPCPIEVRVQ